MPKKQSTTMELADSAHKIWLAGLGALATAGAEGEKLFDTLVRRGEKLEKRVNKPVGKATAKVRSTVEDARSRAEGTLGSITSTIDDTVAMALRRLGVPTRAEIQSLGKRVEKLTRAVEGGRKPRRVTRKAASTAKKTVRRKTTTRKTAKPRATA